MRAAVLGSPIEHSLSPTLHTAAYAALGLEDRWHYERFECDEDGLARFLDGCDASWAGLSLTMPLKRVAMALADDLAEPVTEVGGANTIVFQDGRRHAYNTDVAGIVRALGEAGISRVDSATVVGGGATAASALAALRALGATEPGAITVLARDPARAAPVAEAAARMGLRIGVEPLRESSRTSIPTSSRARCRAVPPTPTPRSWSRAAPPCSTSPMAPSRVFRRTPSPPPGAPWSRVFPCCCTKPGGRWS